jgi:type IV pilus assembly protein PilX
MNTPTTQAAPNEHGITLIVVLIFMVGLSLLAAVGMRQVMTGERINANSRDRVLAFQAAESAGREAIAKVKAGLVAGASGYYTTPFAGGGNAAYWQTTSSLPENSACTYDSAKRFNWGACAAAVTASSKYSNGDAPQYVIEKMPNVTTTATPEEWFRITTRASGATKSADVILQLMYSK